jgi:hypothetical protein
MVSYSYSFTSGSGGLVGSAGGVSVVESSSVSGGSSGAVILESVGGGAVNYGFSSGTQAVTSSIAADLLNISSVSASGGSVSIGGGSAIIGGGFESSAFSALEQAIYQANNPIEVQEAEELTVVGHSGRWINKQEILKWRGEIPITQYIINEDSNPEVIRKKTQQQLLYEQEVAIRYLRPPTPPPPGEIVIKQEANIPTPPAPPLVIRQVPPRPDTPQPLIVREAPPKPPASVGQKLITISGKRLPPAPRKVVIERLAPLPSKPQAIMVERWLPYAERKRRVIFQKNQVPDPIIQKPRNVVVQWEAPEVQIKTIYKDLGVIRADPNDYVSRYGVALLSYLQFPEFVRAFNLRAPSGFQFAHDFTYASLLELEGDVSALNLINLDEHGLGEYRAWLAKFLGGGNVSAPPSFSISIGAMLEAVLSELFSSVDTSGDARIAVNEAQSVLLKLNQRLGRSYSNDDAVSFMRTLDKNGDGFVDFREFKSGLLASFGAQ